jgi:hypothetical protein
MRFPWVRRQACSSACTSKSTYCVNCEVNDHTSWSRECPMFMRKCRKFDIKHPENSLPYYPSSEPWTLAAEPQPLEPEQACRLFPPPPIETQAATQRLRQQRLNFATGSNANLVSSQGTVRHWGNSGLQPAPQRAISPAPVPYSELSDQDIDTPGYPPAGANSWFTE